MAPNSGYTLAIAALLLLLYLPACTSWAVRANQTTSYEEFLQNEQPESVRATKADGSTVVLTSPEVHADSLVGIVVTRRVQTRGTTTDTISIAISDVRQVEVKKNDTWKTVGLVAGLALFSYVFIIVPILWATDN